jgi:hypothetical protein
MHTKLILILLVAGCAVDAKTKNQCDTEADCLDGYECGTDNICRATICTPKVCGNQCGEVADGCGGTLSCGICPPDQPCTGSCLTKPRKVFTTSAVYQGGKLGGLGGADQICQTHASNAHLNGTFRAWLSDSTGSPLTRMVRGTGDYVLVDGTVVARGWDDLIDGQLVNRINIDETGAFHIGTGGTNCMGGISAWTGTDFNGMQYTPTVGNPDDSCGNWSAFKTGDKDTYGLLGNTTESNKTWTIACSMWCTESSALYCLEQ